jgi:hypothetical protein
MSRRALFALLLFAALPLSAATADVAARLFAIPAIVVDPGETFSFDFDVAVQGNDPAPGARATVQLPGGSVLVSATSTAFNCSQAAPGVVCDAKFPLSGEQGVVLTVKAPENLAGSLSQITVTATSDATDPLPDNNSASAPLTVRRVLLVTNDSDDGDETLRRRIDTMNATCGGALPCRVKFSRAMTIEPLSPLPAIHACNSGIDGSGGVELRGDRAGSGDGIVIRTACSGAGSKTVTDGVTIRSLAINGFPGDGVTAGDTSANHNGPSVRDSVELCTIAGNAQRGIATTAETISIAITGNTITNNLRSGIAFWQVGSATVANNQIVANGASGAFVFSGTATFNANVIDRNHEYGIATSPFGRYVNGGNALRDNVAMPVDLMMDGPSRAGAVQPPVLTDAFFDPATKRTIVRGTLAGVDDPLAQAVFRVQLQVASGINEHGYPNVETAGFPGANVVPASGRAFDKTFEVSLPEDLRGKLIVAFTSFAQFGDSPTLLSSEYSDAIVVRN